MQTIAIVNNKGGVGKTTLTINLACGLSRAGFHVLVIDIDPQANATMGLTWIDHYCLKKNIVTLLAGDTSEAAWVEDTIEPRVRLIPGHLDLDAYSVELQSRPYGSPLLLKQRLDALPLYGIDIILIDCPPSLGLLTAYALTASTHYIVPIESGSKYAVAGMVGLERLVTHIQPLNPNLTLLGALLQRHDGRRLECKRSIESASRRFSSVFETTISNGPAKMQACQAKRRNIFQIDRDCSSALDYYRLTKEVLQRLSLTPRQEMTDVPSFPEENKATA